MFLFFIGRENGIIDENPGVEIRPTPNSMFEGPCGNQRSDPVASLWATEVGGTSWLDSLASWLHCSACFCAACDRRFGRLPRNEKAREAVAIEWSTTKDTRC